MSVKSSPYTMSVRPEFGYYVDKMLDEDGLFNKDMTVIDQVLSINTSRRSDELELRDWSLGFGAPVNTRVLKKGTTTVTNKINNKVQHNYLKRLTRIRTGYLGGNPVKYTLDSDYYNEGDIDAAYRAVADFSSQSNLTDIHSETVADCTLYGQSGRLLYIDTPPFKQDAKPTIMMMHVPGYDCIFLAKYQWWMPEISIRYLNDEAHSIEVYDKKFIYTCSGGTVVSAVEHKIGYNPLIPYINNTHRTGNMEDCLSKINDIDEQRSNLSSLLTQLRLVLKIFQDVDIDIENIEQTEQMGYIKLKTNENGQGSVYFEELNIDSAATETHIKELDRAIYLDSGIVNLDDKQFGNESAAAKKFYMIPMESNCVDTESKFRASDYVLWGIVANFYRSIGVNLYPDSINANWSRNLPYDMREDVDIAALLWDKLPRETLYSLLPFIKDPTTEAAKYAEEFGITKATPDASPAVPVMNTNQ